MNALAVDAAGHMYVVRNGVVGVREYAPDGTSMRTLEPAGPQPTYSEGPTPALALDPAGDLFVDVFSQERHWIDEYSPSGVQLGRFDEGKKASIDVVHLEDALPGMTYDASTNRLYLLTEPVASVRIVAPPRP